MSRFILRRVLYSLVTLFILSATIFVIVRLTGDPLALMAEASARPEDLDRIRHQWGLDRSWPVQYATFMQNAFKGELGKSFNYRLPVSELYFQRLPNSLTLGLAATLISLLIGIPAGIISAVKVNSGWDTVAKGVALLGLSIPGFWLGLVLILVFSVWLRWLPTSGSGDWRHVVMPALVLRGVDAEAHPLEHAGGARQRVHQARPAQGAPGLRGHRHARVQERAHSGVHPGRRQHGCDGQCRGHHRGHLRLARYRPAALRRHLPARLPAGPGRGGHGRLHDRRDQPAGGHPVRHHRSQNQAHAMSTR